MKKFILPVLALVVSFGFVLEASAGCGSSRSCRGKLFNGRIREGLSCGSSRVSGCGQAQKVSGCVECQSASKEAASAPAPVKSDKK